MPEDMLPKDIPLQSVHTLETDAAEAIAKENISKSQIIAAKVNNPEPSIFPQQEETPSHLLKNILVTGVIIIALVGAAIGIFYYFNKRSQQPPVSTQPALKKQELLPYDSIKEIKVSNEEASSKDLLAARIFNEARSTSNGTTLYKISDIPFSQLLLTLSPSLPGDYYRAMVDDKAFYGGISSGNFFVIKVDSYQSAYAGMLSWESSMANSLFPLFSIPSSTFLTSFKDEIVANKDTRAAVDKDGNVLFVYGFHDSNTIIFARNEETFKAAQEMLLRQNL